MDRNKTIVRNKRLFDRQKAPTLLIKLILCLLLFNSNTSLADTKLTVNSENTEQINRIKSAYIYNFLKYIEFKPESEIPALSNFTVCIFGHDQFEKVLDSLNGRKAKGLALKVKRTNDEGDLFDCQIVYISQSEKNQFNKILDSIKSHSILTVSEIKNFAKNGGIIGFDNRDNKIVIEINLKNALNAEIKVSAMLLEIATVIE